MSIRPSALPRSAGLALMAGVALLVVSAPVMAGSPLDSWVQNDEDRVVRSGDKVRIGSGVTVEEDEVVMGDVVSILGSARIDGQVTGDTVVVLGDLTLGSNARVNNVTVVGGEVRRRRGARVRGDLNEIGIGRLRPRWNGWAFRNPLRFGFRNGARIGWTLFRLTFLAVLVLAVVFVAPATVRKVGQQAMGSPWKAGLIGFAIQIFFLPVLVVTAVLLAISIIGIPLLLLLPFVVLGLIVAALIGFTGVAYEVGRWITARGGRETDSMFLTAALGVLAILAVALAGRGVALGGGLFSLFAAILLACAFLIEYAAWTVGIGATTLAVFSGKQYTTPPPAPPPASPPPPSTGAAPIGAPPLGPPPAAPAESSPASPANETTTPSPERPALGTSPDAPAQESAGAPSTDSTDLRIVERPPAAPAPPPAAPPEPPSDDPPSN